MVTGSIAWGKGKKRDKGAEDAELSVKKKKRS